MIGLSRCLPFPTKCLTPLADRCFFIRLNRERVQLKPDAEQNFIIQWTNPSVVRFMPHSLHSPHFVLLKAHTCPIGYCRNCFTLYTFRGVYQLFLSSFFVEGDREREVAHLLYGGNMWSACACQVGRQLPSHYQKEGEKWIRKINKTWETNLYQMHTTRCQRDYPL